MIISQDIQFNSIQFYLYCAKLQQMSSQGTSTIYALFSPGTSPVTAQISSGLSLRVVAKPAPVFPVTVAWNLKEKYKS